MRANFFGRLKKENGKLIFISPTDKKQYQQFIDSVPEGETVEFYSEIVTGNGNLAQLAKIHKMIRLLCHHTGHTFREMKLVVKDRAGMCYTGYKADGTEELICKSFGDSSSDELNLVIKAIQEIGQDVNYPIQ